MDIEISTNLLYFKRETPSDKANLFLKNLFNSYPFSLSIKVTFILNSHLGCNAGLGDDGSLWVHPYESGGI